MALNLNGLIPATVLPMDADGGIDEPTLRSYIRWVVDQGPVALAINVDTGEGPHLTHDEKVRILRVVREVTDLPIVAGLAGSLPETCDPSEVRAAWSGLAAGATLTMAGHQIPISKRGTSRRPALTRSSCSRSRPT